MRLPSQPRHFSSLVAGSLPDICVHLYLQHVVFFVPSHKAGMEHSIYRPARRKPGTESYLGSVEVLNIGPGVRIPPGAGDIDMSNFICFYVCLA